MDLSRSAEFNNSTVIGKRLFLEGYHQARFKALTERTIRSGWRAAGLWPVNINKPLLGPLLLENRNFQQQTPATPCPIRVQVAFSPKNPGDISRSIQNSFLVGWKTPESAKNIKSQLGFYSRLTGSDSTQRLLFSKIQKGWDSKDLELAMAYRRINQLESQFVAVVPRERQG